ncbi:MAG TPA: hypothetical protein VMT85_02575 [Thermoanaerobaculia bacterium]|nr:hypothetical protein [Thermoanaerobaculia bacterium]
MGTEHQTGETHDAGAPAGWEQLAGQVFGLRVEGRLPGVFARYLYGPPADERGERLELRYRAVGELAGADEIWRFEPEPPFAPGRFALVRHSGGVGLTVSAEESGRFLFAASAIEIEWRGSAATAAHHLFSHALPLWLETRGTRVLHASAVAFGAGAVAFVGPSGVGKSTLCAELVRAGCAFVADDALALSEGPSRRWYCSEGPPLVRLWPSALERLREPADELERVPGGIEKRQLRPEVDAAVLPSAHVGRELRAVYELQRGERGEQPVRLTRRTSREALVRLIAHSLAAGPAGALGLAAERFDRLSSLALAVPVSELRFPSGADSAARVHDAIDKDLALAAGDRGPAGSPRSI